MSHQWLICLSLSPASFYLGPSSSVFFFKFQKFPLNLFNEIIQIIFFYSLGLLLPEHRIKISYKWEIEIKKCCHRKKANRSRIIQVVGKQAWIIPGGATDKDDWRWDWIQYRPKSQEPRWLTKLWKQRLIEADYEFMNEANKWVPLHGNQNSVAINERKYTNKIRIKRLKVNVRRFFLTRFDVLYVFRSLSFLVYLNKDWVSLHYKGLFICSRVIKRMSKEQWNNCLLSSRLTDHPTRPSLLIARRSSAVKDTDAIAASPPIWLSSRPYVYSHYLSSHSSSTSHQSAL